MVLKYHEVGFVKRYFRLKENYIFKLWEGVNKNFGQQKFIWVSATKSWEKSINFRYGLPEDFLSKGNPPHPRSSYRVNVI